MSKEFKGLKLSECRGGMLVTGNGNQVGMISGVTINPVKEVIIIVEWQNGRTQSIHPSNTMKLDDRYDD